MTYTAAVITVSDKGSRGERVDTSGPALCAMLEDKGFEIAHTAIVPDDMEAIKAELCACADEKNISLILTTGGTGFSPRDITPEATLAVVQRRCPGIGEAMRAESLRITPKGCLSRGEAGIRGRSLIINLPGSEKAAKENLGSVIGALDHGIEMLLGSGSAGCAEAPASSPKAPPSVDQWLREAKNDPRVGMYLVHNGVVRASARANVRSGEDCPEVRGMEFSYDARRLAEIEAAAMALPGIYMVRTWLNEGRLSVGDDLMYALVGGDIRDRVIDARQYLVGRIKNECVKETEIF